MPKGEIANSVLPDLLVSDGTDIFMRQMRFRGGNLDDRDIPRQADFLRVNDGGLLDSTWINNNFWKYGRAQGQMLVFDGDTVYGIEGVKNLASKSYPQDIHIPGKEGYRLYAMDIHTPPAQKQTDAKQTRRGKAQGGSADLRWATQVPIRAQAMVVTDSHLVLAGTPDLIDPADPWAAFEERRGGRMQVFSKETGKSLVTEALDTARLRRARCGRWFPIPDDNRRACVFQWKCSGQSPSDALTHLTLNPPTAVTWRSRRVSDPGNCSRHRQRNACADPLDRLVVDLVQGRVSRVMMLFVRIVAGRVVTADQHPTRLIGPILIGTVEQISMEEHRVAGLHFHVHQFKPPEGRVDPFHVGPGLVAGEHVIDPAHAVRPPNHLQTAVFPRGRIDGDHHAGHVGKQAAVLVPITVVLVPRPGPANARLFHVHLRVVMVHLSTEQLFHRVDQPPAPREHAVDIVARMVPQGQASDASFAVTPFDRMLVECLILPGGPAQKRHFFGVIKPAAQRRTRLHGIGEPGRR